MGASDYTNRVALEEQHEAHQERQDIYLRISSVEQDISGLKATLANAIEMLRELRNEQMRPKPGTNWLGIITLALTLVAGGAVYVQTQINPIKDTLDFLTKVQIRFEERQVRLLENSATAKENRKWLEMLEERAYSERRNLRGDFGAALGVFEGQGDKGKRDD